MKNKATLIPKIVAFIADPRKMVAIFILFAVLASVQSLLLGKKKYQSSETEYTHYNNYKIFKHSFYHLKSNKDLYIGYPDEHHDLFKYSPTFAVFFGFLAILPDWAGLSLWNIINALFLVFAVYYLPRLDNKTKGLLLTFCLIELMTSMQNDQSNALIAGLIILCFGLLEKKKYLWATLCIVFSVFIKLFGFVGFALFIFYPRKLKLLAYSIVWAFILIMLPLIFIDIEQYQMLFTSWVKMLSGDHDVSYGLSVMGWLHTWFGFEPEKLIIVFLGIIGFLLPLLKVDQYQDYIFRLLMLSSVLIWVVIFNHKAESPTFILAMAGVSIWFFSQPGSIMNIILFVSGFIFTSLSPTDIFPPFIRNELFKPYVIKVVPCILIWIKLIFDMLRIRNDASRDVIISP